MKLIIRLLLVSLSVISLAGCGSFIPNAISESSEPHWENFENEPDRSIWRHRESQRTRYKRAILIWLSKDEPYAEVAIDMRKRPFEDIHGTRNLVAYYCFPDGSLVVENYYGDKLELTEDSKDYVHHLESGTTLFYLVDDFTEENWGQFSPEEKRSAALLQNIREWIRNPR